jgi:cell division protein FtsA
VTEPVGMSGMRLEANVHIITGAAACAQNIYHSVKKAGIHLRDLVLEPLASSHAVLNEDEKDLGVALIDIGGGTTDVVVFHQGSIRHTAVIGFGGEIVTRDVATVLEIATEMAEKLKIERGAVFPPMPDAPPINIPPYGEWPAKQVEAARLNAVLYERMDEILRMVMKELRRVDLLDLLSMGVVLTGGASQLRGTTKLAGEIFRKPARIGIPRGLHGLADTVHSPAYSTAVGLVLFALKEANANGDSISARSQRNALVNIWGSLRGIFD